MERYLNVAVMMLEALFLLWGAKQLWGVVLRRDMNTELTTHDNPAVAITLAGYFFGVLIALAGVAAAPGSGGREDLLSFAAFGAAGVLVLFLSLFAAPLVGGIKLRRDILEQRNVSAAMVLAATFIATGLIFSGAVRGEGAGLAAWVALFLFQLLGQVVLALMAHLFEYVTPYDLHLQITEGQNPAAAVGYAGALVAMGVILQNAVLGDIAYLATDWTSEVRTFLIWCAPLLLLWPVRSLVVNGLLLGFGNLNREISEDRNVGVGVIEAVTYIGFAWVLVSVA
ncbi:MAG: DUF350 domain-containing protein [Candidatus Sericytochromatia bacterium]|nr:DUF350 domain-containing protein [Candidatus Sericytochromatia bacterium]